MPEAYYLARESVELAFAAASVRDPAGGADPARGAGFSAAEVAEQLDTSTASVNSALKRARRAIGSAAPTQQTVLRDLRDAAVADIAARWADAWRVGDVNTIVAILADDAATRCRRCPVVPRQGRDPRLLNQRPAAIALAFLPTTANGQVAFGTYLRDEAAGAYVSCGLDVLTLLDGCVAEIVASRTVDLTRFGLPARIPP